MKAFLSTKVKLDLKLYRKLVGYPLWGFFCQAIHTTRSYKEGLEFGLFLIHFTETSLNKLSEQEQSRNLKLLYRFVLWMLDALDRWEEYLETWATLRANTGLTDAYPKNEWNLQNTSLHSFLVREEPHILHVHFLWPTLERKQIIERKMRREPRRGKTGNLFHRQKSELTEKEIQRRLGRLKDKIHYCEKMMELVNLARRPNP